MKGTYLVAVFWSLIALPLSSAWAFVDPPTISPQNPAMGEVITISIRSGVCDGFLSDIPPLIEQNGNLIRVVVEGVSEFDPIHCNIPTAINEYFIGGFPSGSYLLQIDRHYVPFGLDDVTETLATFQLEVSGGTSTVALPANGSVALFILVLLVLAMAGCAFRWRRAGFISLVLALAFHPLPSDAQEPDQHIKVLVSIDPKAPTADDLVNYFDFSPPAGPPPLHAFEVVAPVGIHYLLPIRATGDFLAYLEKNPDSVRARLERYVVVAYAANVDIAVALSSLRNDPFVVGAFVSEPAEFSSVTLIDFGMTPGESLSAGIPTQYGLGALNITAAWQLAGGYALIGSADTGLAVEHPELQQFSSSGGYLGGNFVPASSLDVGDGVGNYDSNVDEVSLMPLPLNSPCNPDHLPGVETATAGHGTHVVGLQAANSTNGFGVQGTCKHCGIAMWKIARNQCVGTTVLPRLNPDTFEAAVTYMTDTGAQVANLSLGTPRSPADYCPSHPLESWCMAIAHADFRGAVIVASSGNHRQRLQFPASDSRVIAAGGFDSNLALWDESPGSTTFCPTPGSILECGTNYTTIVGKPRQESMASSKAVFSTTYPGKDYSSTVECGDSFGTPLGDGFGLCTGTSMSAPQISGVVGILRSINPLVLSSKPVLNFGDVAGIRTVLAQTTVEAQNNQPWMQTFGYGRPDAAAAASRMLGKVEGRTVKNRVTPLFRLYGANSKDYADTTTPQLALALLIYQADSYQPKGSTIPGYSAFPTEPGTTPLPVPRAGIYVLTTEYKPRSEWPEVVPLHMMDRSRNFPAGCATGASGCNSTNRDFTLVTTIAHIEQLHTDGYNLRAIQGYIYKPCTPEPGCIPPGAQKFYRACKTADDDCATFLESERTTFEAAGYTAAYPSGSSKVLGYAYPYADSELPAGDGLIDGFEYVIGTKINVADSDGDGTNDAIEFPMVGVPLSDPCSGSAGWSCPSDVIFKDGFD